MDAAIAAAAAAEAALKSTSPFETGITFTKTIHREPYPTISPSRPELSQAGRTVLITGGSMGIGFAIAKGFSQAGAKRVIILGRRQNLVEEAVSDLRKEFPKVQFDGLSSDVDDLADTEKLWKGFEEDGTVIDVLVLNAAKISTGGAILALGRDDVWSSYTMNVRSLLDLTERFYKQKNGGGRQKFLVNVSTEATHNFTKAGPWPAYSASKNAGTILIQLIAKDTPPEEMQVVNFHPGVVRTSAFINAGIPEDFYPFDTASLGGNFAVWAASEEARFLHGRFVWAKWDVEELKTGEIGEKIRKNDHYLKVGVVGLQE
ncbi:short-chain dehydrogenase [Colletotrichum higginsianum]|uniref:Short-chain dehydrogenase n=2 Tax=Colletotrichum higginsianum TaxID=80884 RepID=H1V6I4_COLHI|nr:Short-chain dehydrogenase [Colletotrichum higginsianum IMI 349063]OBR02304.1 Short-chain dehydrogenase [Colletotrichum higginsianum IMI 349063]TID06528.1 Short chain dehydrogenase andI [Colletotrichum higginsianum]CCF35836.1 short-chain dehydrogenase [Colletotrichum higginsianum]